ncbi:MAG TPA: hypothetical protein VK892_16325 [Pyrinomonadaceae bacterium]|nr:hypothetical protein [Pyrinomonadaceae bacterium]
MSYLNSPRLTFAGQFQADPSTVNNDPTHFDNATFIPVYQEYQAGNNMNGWWNPDGTGSWRFVGCKITSVTYKDGTTATAPADDPIIGMSLMDADSRVAGKIVDLDAEQQMVSMLWGLIVRIAADGNDVMKGEYEPAAFTNIWFTRSLDLTTDAAAGAVYQSVIKNIVWDIEKLNSRYLRELKETSPKQLSIQFNIDRYDMDHTSAQFTLGRIAGSIGPSNDGEPNHFVLGRQLFPQANNCNYAVALVDENPDTLTVDLGNALQFSTGGKVAETRNLAVAVDKGSDKNPDYVYLGKINYSDPDWYANSAGICKFTLSKENLKLVNKFPLVIVDYQITGQTDSFTLNPPQVTVVLQESVEYVCADQFVFRLNPGESCQVNFFATNKGKPLFGKSIEFRPDTSNTIGPPPSSGSPLMGVPDILTFNPNKSVKTDSNGKASIKITGADPGNPRGYIDGQVYGISYNLSDQQFQNCNQANFISLLVFDSVPKAAVKNPTWDDIQPIMQQYANLYPIMSKGIFNLADKNVVDANAEILKFVFSKEKTDPNYMPATRDLSRDKQQMILNYLDGVLNAKGTKKTVTTRNP